MRKTNDLRNRMARPSNDGSTAAPSPKEVGTEEFMASLGELHGEMQAAVDGLDDKVVAKVNAAIDKTMEKVDAKVEEYQAVVDAQAKMKGVISDLEARLNLGEFASSGDEKGSKFSCAAEKAYVDALEKVFRGGKSDLAAMEAARAAFADYLPNFKFANELTTDKRTAGGVLVAPPAITDAIASIKQDRDVVRAVANIQRISSESWETVINTADFGVANNGEREIVASTSTGNLVKINIPVHDYDALPVATQKMLRDSAYDIVAFVNKEAGIGLVATQGVDYVTGSGVKKARGFLEQAKYGVNETIVNQTLYDQIQVFITGADGGIPASTAGAFDGFIDAQESLATEFALNATWMMNKTTRSVLRKAVDADGRLLWQPDFQSGFGMPLFDSPVRISPSMPSITTTDAYCVAIADWTEFYTIVDHVFVIMMVDEITEKGLVKYWFREASGGDVVIFPAGKLIKSAV